MAGCTELSEGHCKTGRECLSCTRDIVKLAAGAGHCKTGRECLSCTRDIIKLAAGAGHCKTGSEEW